jgi:hypothetical protein
MEITAMKFRNFTSLALAPAAALVVASGVAFAQDPAAPAPAGAPAAAATQAQPITADKEKAIIGMPVITADGQTVGQVLSVGPGQNTKALALSVKPSAELGAKSADVKIPLDKAELNGRSVQLVVSMEDVKKFYVR